MKDYCMRYISIVFLVCLLLAVISTAKEAPTVTAVDVSKTASVELQYELCGSCDENFDKSLCDFSGDICTELLAPLELNYTYLGCLNDRRDGQSAEPTIQDLTILADYLFRDSKQLTCEDLVFLSNSQILDGVSITTLTEVISELFERVDTAVTEK